MEYVSPGDAFSSSLEHSLLLRAQQQRQALQDQLAAKREDRLMQAELDSAQERRDRIREHDEDQKQKAHEKTVAELEKRTSKMVPGDIPDPEMMATADKVGVGGTMFPKPAESMPGIAAVPVGSVRLGMAGPADAAVRPYIGDAKQRQDAEEKAATLKAIAAMPAGPQRQAIETAVSMGVKPSVEMFKPQGSSTVGQFRRDSKGNAQRSVVGIDGRGGWQDWAGDVPKDAVWALEKPDPAPRDTTGRDIQRENMRNQAYNTATTDLNKVSAPLEAKLSELETVDGALNERSVAADAHIAPLILKALVAGTGSGFRMTQSEIQQVQNARTKWQSMEAGFRKWAANPQDALFFDEHQRGEFLRLVQMVRAAAERHLEPIMKARHDIDSAENPRDIQKRVSALHDERAKGSKDDKPDTSKPKSASDYLKEFNERAAGAKK